MKLVTVQYNTGGFFPSSLKMTVAFGLSVAENKAACLRKQFDPAIKKLFSLKTKEEVVAELTKILNKKVSGNDLYIENVIEFEKKGGLKSTKNEQEAIPEKGD